MKRLHSVAELIPSPLCGKPPISLSLSYFDDYYIIFLLGESRTSFCVRRRTYFVCVYYLLLIIREPS